MDKLRARIYKEVPEDMSAHFDVGDKFIKEKMGKICAREKISV